MNDHIKFFKIGIFVLSAAFLLFAGLIYLGAGDYFKEKNYAETYFNGSVQGLDVGSPVKYRGMQIGSVASIQSASARYHEDSPYILVTFTIKDTSIFGADKQAIQKAVDNGLRVNLGLQGLTGAAYLETNYFEKGRIEDIPVPWKPRYPYIPSVPGKIKRLTESVDHILKNMEKIDLKRITVNLNSLLERLDTKVEAVDTEKVSHTVTSLVSEMRETNMQLSQAVKKFNTQPVLDHTLSLIRKINRIVENMEQPLTTFAADLETTGKNSKSASADAKTLVKELDESLSGIPAAVDSVEKAADRINETVYFHKHDLRTILENLKTMSSNLKEISENLKTYPGSILFNAPPEKINRAQQKE
ncbi:MAG: MlaD family protein [Desulfarculaceae bacterium]|nr:MlaD family protein [Desulfarculaceae bacterium]